MSDTMDTVSTLTALYSSVHTAYGTVRWRMHMDARRRMATQHNMLRRRHRTATQCVWMLPY